MKITHVITTYNRAHLLKHTLRRLAELTVADEIIVVDDGGSDNTREVCAMAPLALPIRYIYNHNPGPSICSMARNIGIKAATHDWIVTSEPELLFFTDIIEQFRELHTHHPMEVISTGEVILAPEGWNWEHRLEPGFERAIGWVAPHAALWKKDWLIKVGGWDEGFPGAWGWDDTDLLTRLRLSGHGQHIAAGVVAVHQFHGLGGDPGGINEAHFRAKSFCRDESDLTDLVANRGMEWGKLKTKS